MPDVSACGGIEEALAIGDIAQDAGAELTLHSSSSAVLFLASLHVAAAHAATHSVELHMMHRWFYDIAGLDTLKVSGGQLTIPDRPGLGIEPIELLHVLDEMPENRVHAISAGRAHGTGGP